jgi:hypothetical protein
LSHLLFFVGVALASTLFAMLEIQIEGGQGWAAGLPTWKVDNRLTRLCCGNRPLTGYHFYMHLLVLTFLHLPFLIGLAEWTWRHELRVLGFLILFYITEDFLWFVFNPAFGLRRFKREHIWWHAPSWWWIMPRDYWVFLPVGVGMYLVSQGLIFGF